MITLSDIKNLWDMNVAGEIGFCVSGSEEFDNCWMGKDNSGVYWFGLTPDSKNEYDFSSFDELINAKVFDGKSLSDVWRGVDVLEIDGCDAEEMAKLRLD